MKIANDCSRCLARNDGAFATYCFHVIFSDAYPGDGRIIACYPKTPRWCPGMVRELVREEPLGPEPVRRKGR